MKKNVYCIEREWLNMINCKRRFVDSKRDKFSNAEQLVKMYRSFDYDMTMTLTMITYLKH